MSPHPIQILYATVSGNAEQLAEETGRRLTEAGQRVEVRNLAEVSLAGLETIDTALFIVSTWGDGEPPPDAADFFARVAEPGGPRLEGLRYAVLALGSSSYPDFCACGRRLDEDLSRRGARRLLPRAECDVKLKTVFEDWLGRVKETLARP